MAHHVLLDNVTHRNLKIRRDFRPGGGFDVSLARVFPGEFYHLQAEFPLFLMKGPGNGDFEAVALFGFDAEENLYLGPEGWDARVMPMTIERQPFLIGFQESPDGSSAGRVPVVHVDLDHPSVGETEGEPVFLPQGGDSPILERATSLLKAIHEGHETSRRLSRLLVGLDLVESVTVDVEFRDGSSQSLAGLYTVNEERLQGLNAAALEALHQAGHLRDLYFLIASQVNVRALIERKNRRLSG